MSAHTNTKYTYSDYLATPEDSSRRYEIVEGELFVTAAPRPRHQQVVMSISRILSTLALEHELGEVLPGPITVWLHDDTVTEPDIIFLRADHLHLVESGRVHGPPDLVIEILSPSNRGYDRSLKRARYMAYGVPELWIVDADANTIEVWRPAAEEPDRRHDVIEWRVEGRTFEIPLADVFRS
jgi:Uma2 family endonuclease